MNAADQTKINRLCQSMLESARQLDILLMGTTTFSTDEEKLAEIKRQLDTFSFKRFVGKINA